MVKEICPIMKWSLVHIACLHTAYGLRDAHAYVLVYDLLNPESFEYITNLFHQGSISSSGYTYSNLMFSASSFSR